MKEMLTYESEDIIISVDTFENSADEFIANCLKIMQALGYGDENIKEALEKILIN